MAGADRATSILVDLVPSRRDWISAATSAIQTPVTCASTTVSDATVGQAAALVVDVDEARVAVVDQEALGGE